jgi:3',5'-cyclic AMP phosphodiesterase CpdA
LFSGTTELETTPIYQYGLADDPLFIRGPTVNMVTNHSALVFWRTDVMTNATVHYGLNGSVLERTENSTLDTDHRVALQGLDIDSKYYYRVESNGTQSELYHFKTAPADGEEFTMMIIGDNRPHSVIGEQPEAYKQLVQMIAAEEPHIIIHSGDCVLDVSEDHESNLYGWEAFTNETDKMGHYAPIYAAVGNHDTGAKTGTLRLDYFFDAFEQYDEPSTYYSFDYAGVHFTFLDTEELGYEGRIVGDQYDWLVNDLESTDCEMKFVVAHRPMYPLSHVGDSLDSVPAERAALQQLFETHNVSLFICGHDHLYNRMTVNGVVNLISGGGGGPLYGTPWGGDFYHYVRIDVSSSLVNMSAIKLDGTTADNHQLPYEGPIEIFLRGIANTSTRGVGTTPEIYFSEVPAEKYYSWDSGENQTELSGLPNENGLHTLEVFARNSEDVWSSARYVFTAVGATSSSTTPTGTGGAIDPLVMFGSLGVAGVVVVVLVVFWLRRRT